MKVREYLREFDWHLLFIAFVLTSLGIAFIWSSTQDSDFLRHKPVRQCLFLLACVPPMLIILKLGYRTFARYAFALYFVLLIMLGLVLFFGRSGTSRWFDFAFGFGLQPSEFMKLGLILALARYYTFPRNLTTFGGLIPPFLLTVVPMVLIARQPDLGTALIFIPLFLGIVFICGFPIRKLLLLLLIGAVGLPLAYHLPILKDYQRERVTSFLQSIPELDNDSKRLKQEGRTAEAARLDARILQLKRGSGYQQFYSMVSIGSGGILGQGLASGPQNRMNTIPERHTDFIFAIVGEEWGFLGCSAILLLFFLLTAVILGIGRRTREPFGRVLCTGVALLFATQALVNTAISMGLLPITGLTLPFISYGGSSLLSSFIALAFVLDVGARRITTLGPRV